MYLVTPGVDTIMIGMRSREYQWLEFSPRPKKDGIHDSGYRYIRLVGVYVDDDGNEVREDLHQWSDHVVFHSTVNIDVTKPGVIRIMPWGGTKQRFIHYDGTFFSSSAMIHPADFDQAIKHLVAEKSMVEDIYEKPHD